MAYTFDVNQTPIDGAAAIFQLVMALQTAGWTIHAYGTGAGGTRTGSGAGFAVTSLRDKSQAWVAVKRGTRTFVFQRDDNTDTPPGTNTDWWVGYCEGGLTTGGTATLADPPTVALDTKDVWGTEAEPAQLFPADDALGAFRCNVGADGASPYTWYMACWNKGTGDARTLLFFDKANGSSVDPEPYVMHASYKASAPWAGAYDILASGSLGPFSWYKRGLGGAAFARTVLFAYADTGGQWAPGFLPVEPVESKDTLLLSLYGQNVASTRYPKGGSTMVAWSGGNRTTGFTFNVDGVTDDRVCVTHSTFPWPSGVAAVI